MSNGQPGASQMVHCCKTVKRQFLHETQLLINEVAAVWPTLGHPHTRFNSPVCTTNAANL